MTDILQTQRLIPLHMVSEDETLGFPGHCLFRYSSALPWGITLVFRDASCMLEFTMDRGVLADGIETEDGYGDVYVRAHDDGVHITLFPAVDEPAVYCFDRDALLDFLDETWQLVEAGREGEFFQVPDDVIGAIQIAGDW